MQNQQQDEEEELDIGVDVAHEGPVLSEGTENEARHATMAAIDSVGASVKPFAH